VTGITAGCGPISGRNALQCRGDAVQCSAVQCRGEAVQCSAVQCSAGGMPNRGWWLNERPGADGSQAARQPSGHLAIRPSGHLAIRPSGHLPRQPSGHLPRQPSGHLAIRPPAGLEPRPDCWLPVRGLEMWRAVSWDQTVGQDSRSISKRWTSIPANKGREDLAGRQYPG
jgi:hypothetical protein